MTLAADLDDGLGRKPARIQDGGSDVRAALFTGGSDVRAAGAVTAFADDAKLHVREVRLQSTGLDVSGVAVEAAVYGCRLLDHSPRGSRVARRPATVAHGQSGALRHSVVR